jgi:outer membrane protein assembly factor BamB
MTRFLFLISIATSFVSTATADDWPQWMGPQRDNVWRETGIAKELPAGGPKILWRQPIAGGYAGPAVANGRVYVTDYQSESNLNVDNFTRQEFTGKERVLCLDERTGGEKWRHEYPVKYTISYPAGPRCTPTVHDGKVYTLGAEGNLFCLDAMSGKVLWSKDFNTDYNTKTALWGYTGHPLVDGKKLICVVGGEDSLVVAFDKDTGAEIWKALTSMEKGYSPPTILQQGGKRQLVQLRPDAVTSLDPETGRENWSVPYDATNGLVVMSPVLWQNYIFVGGFMNKNMLTQVAQDATSAEAVWASTPKHAISPINVQPNLVDDVLYGFDQNGRLYGMQLPSGDRLWDTAEVLGGDKPPNSGTAFIVRQDDRFFLFTENGDLVMARFSPEGYTELGRAHILEPTGAAFGRNVVWSAPAYANKHMYARNDKEIVAVDLSAK